MEFYLSVNRGEFLLRDKVTHIRQLSVMYDNHAKEIEEFKTPEHFQQLEGKRIEVWFVGGYYARFDVDYFGYLVNTTYTLRVTTTHDGKMRHKTKDKITISEYVAKLEREEAKEKERECLEYKLGIDADAMIKVNELKGINLSAKDVTLNETKGKGVIWNAYGTLTLPEHLANSGLIKMVNVIGTEYEVHLKVPFESDDYLDGCDGYCDYHAKKIVIGDFSKKNGYEWSDLKAFENKVLRHELAHAFLYESGMNDLARDEKLVDWIAIQFPKLNKVFEEVGANE